MVTEASPPPAGLESIFAIPFYRARLPNADALNLRLMNHLLEWETAPPTQDPTRPSPVRKHNVYESPFDFFYWEDTDVQLLARFCLNHLGHLIQSLNGYTVEEMAELRIHHHSWFHLTRAGGYTSYHHHPMASWSGVYCVDPGLSNSTPTVGGVLRFFDPRTNSSMFLDPGNSYLGTPYTFGVLEHHFQAGELILFPSYLYHEVSPYTGGDIRITVAFNTWVRYQDEPALPPGYRRTRGAPAHTG